LNSPLILVDTSMWIIFMHRDEDAASEAVSQLLSEDRVVINEIIKSELLIGAKDQKHYQELEEDLAALPDLSLTKKVWDKVRSLGFILKCKGRIVPLPDLVIAASAIVYGCDLLHRDRHFGLIAGHESLKLHKLSLGV